MLDFRITSHAHFDDACRKFSATHNLAELAKRTGIKAHTLCNKLNTDQPHKLTCEELLMLTDITEDATLIDGLLAQLNCLPAVPVNEARAERLTAYVLQATAAVGKVAAESVSDERMTQTRRHNLMGTISDGVRYLSLIGLTVQSRIQANPAMASTLDALSGLGASLTIV